MKITVGQLRRVIKEEISRVMGEAEEAPMKKALSSVAEAWMNQYNPKFATEASLNAMAQAWDAMVAVRPSLGKLEKPEEMDMDKLRDAAKRIAGTAGKEWTTVQFHLRKISETGDTTTGADLLAVAKDIKSKKDARDAESARQAAIQQDAISAFENAKDEEGNPLFDLSFLASDYMAAEAAPYQIDPGRKITRWEAELAAAKASTNQLYDQIYKAWDPSSRTLDVEALKATLPKRALAKPKTAAKPA